MAALIVGDNVCNLGIGNAVKLKHQPHSPVMTIAGIQRGKPEGSNVLVTVASCNWFEEDGTPRGLQVEINALQLAE